LTGETLWLRYKKSAELINSVDDPVTQKLMMAAATCIIKRFLANENLPIENFDLRFFSETMLELCSDHKLIQSILNGEEVGWFEADKL
jgi:hypothetical protein